MPHVHRARHPDFWSPQRKPLAPVEIDWTHPLARDLVGYWLYNGPLPIGCRNLVTGQALPVNGTAPAVVTGPSGLALRANATAGGFSAENYGTSGLIPFTVAARAARTNTNTGAGFFSIRTSAGSQRNNLAATAAHLPTYTPNYGTAVTLTGTTTLAIGAPNTLVGTTRSATDHELFVDGLSEATSASSCNTSPGQRAQLILGQVGGGIGREMDYYWVGAWARAFTAEEAMALHLAPYALLRPAG